jgi:hypothetical protein
MQGPYSVEKQRVLAIVQAVGETIKEFGPNGVPLGHLYAHLMGIMTYNTFTSMIDAMVTCKQIKVSNNVATWIGGSK